MTTEIASADEMVREALREVIDPGDTAEHRGPRYGVRSGRPESASRHDDLTAGPPSLSEYTSTRPC